MCWRGGYKQYYLYTVDVVKKIVHRALDIVERGQGMTDSDALDPLKVRDDKVT
jgi:hypothetical protein